MTDQKRVVRRAYDEIADDYTDERGDDPAALDLLPDLRERLAADARVLDAGCGSGRPVAAALAEEFDVVGVDFSREQLRRAGQQVPEAAVCQQDMTDLGLRAGAVDAVCAFFSVIHVPTDQHPAVFAEFRRVLRDGGLLLVSLGGEAWEGSNDDWLDTGVEMRWSFPDLDTSLDQLRAAGFEVVSRYLVDDELGGSFPFVLARAA